MRDRGRLPAACQNPGPIADCAILELTMAQITTRFLMTLLSVTTLTACGPSGPPPDVIKTQRQALEKAKGVESVIQSTDDARRKTLDDAEK